MATAGPVKSVRVIFCIEAILPTMKSLSSRSPRWRGSVLIGLCLLANLCTAHAVTTPPVPELQNVVDIATGKNHSCAIVSGGTVHCRGKTSTAK
ncbi:hypothetical protein [Parachitinimonas caeni]|uniref:hypothetical protein n=1 Tax=Parachitinimonas caeni TaxID=3031301 RepID=UPI0038B2E160